MQYAIVIYESAEGFEARTGKDQEAYFGAWQAYADAVRASGVFVAGKGLQSPETGTVVRFRDGERTVQDGPYADTKEQLGGFFIIDVPDLDAALDWAARCPAAWAGAVEVRPILGRCQTMQDGADRMQAALSSAT
jgi:hypothetical protein